MATKKPPPHGIGASGSNKRKPAPPHGIQVPTGPTGPTGPAARPFTVTVPGPRPTPVVPVVPRPTPPTPNTGDDFSGDDGSDDGGGGDGGGGGGGQQQQIGIDPNQFAADWYKAFFSQYGIPADVQAQIVNLLREYAADPSTAVALAKQYLTTTSWYQNTFPGIGQGQVNGLFTDETGYRQYLNGVNQFYNQYLARHVSSDELRAYIAAGYTPDYVGKLLGGSAWAQANTPAMLQVTGAFGDTGQLSDEDLAKLGNEQAGIDTVRGQTLQDMVQRAQQRMQTIFTGRLAAPAGLSLGSAGLSASGFGGLKQSSDVGA